MVSQPELTGRMFFDVYDDTHQIVYIFVLKVRLFFLVLFNIIFILCLFSFQVVPVSKMRQNFSPLELILFKLILQITIGLLLFKSYFSYLLLFSLCVFLHALVPYYPRAPALTLKEKMKPVFSTFQFSCQSCHLPEAGWRPSLGWRPLNSRKKWSPRILSSPSMVVLPFSGGSSARTGTSSSTHAGVCVLCSLLKEHLRRCSGLLKDSFRDGYGLWLQVLPRRVV